MQSSYRRDGGFSSFLAIRRSVATLKDGVLLSLVPGSTDSSGDSSVVLFLDPLLNYLQWQVRPANSTAPAPCLRAPFTLACSDCHSIETPKGEGGANDPP